MSQIVLMHSSDLHMGREPANDHFHSSWPRKLGNAHDFLLGRGLREAVHDVAARFGLGEDEDPYQVVSGDLTASGDSKEFVVAHTFLRSFWREMRSPEHQRSGLELGDLLLAPAPRLATVPGNHDQWKGNGYLNNIGFNPALRGTHFRATCWKRTWTSGELQLELYGIDSNAGLPPHGVSLAQHGSFDLTPGGQIDKLDQDLQANPINAGLPAGVKFRVRAVVLHHSLAGGGRLDNASIDKLLELAEAHHIAVVLTGHTHDFNNATAFATLPHGIRTLVELRSASAMQAPHKRTPAPGFLAHRIYVQKQLVRWQACRYVWDPSAGGFAVLQKDLNGAFFHQVIVP